VHVIALSLCDSVTCATYNAYRQENQHYTVLLIITDGVINDFDNTKVGIYFNTALDSVMVLNCVS
jgi:Mg-chelatase subunit ChlD